MGAESVEAVKTTKKPCFLEAAGQYELQTHSSYDSMQAEQIPTWRGGGQ